MQIALDIFEPNTLHLDNLREVGISRQVDIESSTKEFPLVSCVMVTRGDIKLISSSLYCFNIQSYPNKELIIVYDGSESHLENFLRDMSLSHVRLIKVRNKSSLGELRNIAISSAAGEIICQWDDDDLYDKDRLKVQTSTLLNQKISAVFLKRLLIWWPVKEILAISRRRAWEGSMLAFKSCVPSYPAVARGEDSIVVEEMFRTEKIGLLDCPFVYCYTIHSNNTWDETHFIGIINSCSCKFNYREALSSFSKFMPFVKHVCSPSFLVDPSSNLQETDMTFDNYFIRINYNNITRNAPCPCGSGKRFKHCHGSLV